MGYTVRRPGSATTFNTGTKSSVNRATGGRGGSSSSSPGSALKTSVGKAVNTSWGGNNAGTTSAINMASGRSSSPTNSYISQYTGQPRAKSINSFESITPYADYMSQADGVANSKLMPFFEREERDTQRQYDRSASQAQGYRFGNFYSDRGDILAQMQQQQQERELGLDTQLRGVLDDQYKRLMEQYYTDPNIENYGQVGTPANMNSLFSMATSGQMPVANYSSYYGY